MPPGRSARVRWTLLAAIFAFLVLFGRPVAAGSGDSAIAAGVQRVLSTDFAQANFGEARRKLNALLEKCKKTSCAAPTQAQVVVALGLVASQIGQADEAKADFVSAITLDPTASLPAQPPPSTTAQAQFAEAQKAVASTPPPAAPHNDKTSMEYATAAIGAAVAGNYDLCVQKGKASLAIEEESHTRLQLASCEAHTGKLIDALRDAQQTLTAGMSAKDQSLVKPCSELVQQLLKRLPHVQFVPPANVPDLQVTFDGIAVPPKVVSQQTQAPADPGKHTVHASGTVNGLTMEFEQAYDVQEGDVVVVNITLKPAGPKFVTTGQMQCIREAKNEQEVRLCMPQDTRPLVAVVGVDFGSYADTTAVNVLSPMIHASVSSPTAGWKASGSFLVDVVSAASPDIVSMASPPFHETRYAGTAAGGYKPGRFGADVHGDLSIESDYTSIGGGVGLLGDFADKRVTPRIGFDHREDTIGRAGTPFSFFSHHFTTNAVEAGATFILSPVSVLVVGATGDFERGDQSKPYRLTPMFAQGVNVPNGASTDTVAHARLPVQPYEQLPLARDRYALAARLARRFGQTTLRLEERLYGDTWEQLATTTDVRLLHDFGPRVLAGPHLRVDLQNGANFYRRVYHAVVAPELQLPTFRTTDRELSPLLGVTAGGTVRVRLSPTSWKVGWALVGSGDVLYNRYLDALFVTNRLAFFGTIGAEASFE